MFAFLAQIRKAKSPIPRTIKLRHSRVDTKVSAEMTSDCVENRLVRIRTVGSEHKNAGTVLSASKNPERCGMWQGQVVHGDVGVITFVLIKDGGGEI